MGKYGQAAIRAATLVADKACGSAPEAWTVAVREAFPGQVSSQQKPCPKGVFLGLCEEGLVVGVPRGDYTRSHDNKGYALQAVRLLRRDPSLADPGARDGGATTLWLRVMNGEQKKPNGQMDVVLSLWNHNLISRG